MGSQRMCCSPWGHKDSDTTERLNNNTPSSNHIILWVFFLSPEVAFAAIAATATKSLQSCLTLCDPTDGSPPGSTIPGILQARTLEWVAISFSNA